MTTELVIERDKLVHNLQVVQLEVGVPVIGVLKGNGYGCGLVELATVLGEQGIGFFAVTDLADARRLRESGFEQEILLLAPPSMPSDIKELLELGVIATISNYDGATMAAGVAQAMDAQLPVHLKCDTGFGRYGFLPEEIDRMIQVAGLPGLLVKGVYTHFANAFGKSKRCVAAPLERFQYMLDALKGAGIDCGLVHAANSCAALRFPDTRFDAVRVGSALLGRLPIPDQWGLSRVGHLKSQVVELRNLPADYAVGYASVSKTKRPTRIAVVPCGYETGFGVEKSKDIFRPIDVLRYCWRDLRSLNHQIIVEVAGQRAPVLGRVSMCNVVVDVTGANCEIGNDVILPVNPLFCNSTMPRSYR